MMKKLAFVAVVLMVAGVSQATKVPNPDLVLTVDYATGAATLKNVGTVAHKVFLYQIKSVAGNLNPGTRAYVDDISGDIVPSSPGTWLGMCDSVITNFTATTAALTINVNSMTPLNPTSTSISEASISGGYARFFANSATVWSIGNPVLPNKASSTDLSFFWSEIGMPAADTYIGSVVVIPEPVTVGVLALGGVATLLRKRRSA